MQFPYSLTDQSITIFIDKKPYQTDRTNANWDRIKTEIGRDYADPALLISLVTPEESIKTLFEEVKDITVRNGHVFYGDDKVHSSLSQRILDIQDEGLPIKPWVLFARNVYSNPQKFARQELYDFLEKSDLPITPDGCFLAYKIVDDNYKDIYTHTFDNSIGQIVELPGGRKDVDPNRERTCSYGLHFCSKGYLGHYGTGPGNHVMIVKVNPADVVSIPIDYDHAKGRTFKYEVVGEVAKEDAPDINWASIEGQYDPSFDNWDDYDSSWDDDYDEDYDDYYKYSDDYYGEEVPEDDASKEHEIRITWRS